MWSVLVADNPCFSALSLSGTASRTDVHDNGQLGLSVGKVDYQHVVSGVRHGHDFAAANTLNFDSYTVSRAASPIPTSGSTFPVDVLALHAGETRKATFCTLKPPTRAVSSICETEMPGNLPAGCCCCCC